MVIALTGIVYADQVVPAVPETQILSTSTTADIDGLATETDEGVWTTTNSGSTLYNLVNPGDAETMEPSPEFLAQVLGAGGSFILSPSDPDHVISLFIPESLLNQQIAGEPGQTWQEFIAQSIELGWIYSVSQGGIHSGALNPGQVQYTTAYDASILAQAGHTAFTKSMNIDTRNKVIGQSNLNAKTGITFIATADGGNVVGSENLMIDGAGMSTTASDRMLCPFAAGIADVIPAYCNIVQAGSKFDLTIGSVTTNANDRFVGNDATNPVVLNYDINVRPYGTTQGQIPAMGSAMAYVKAHIQEARVNGTVKDEDLTYNEQSSAQGTITSFQKVIAYQSGKSLL